MRWIAAAITAAFVVFADQMTKRHFFTLHSDVSLEIIPNILELTHHENTGIVANIPLPLPMTIAITAIILAAVITALIQSTHIIETIALAEILGGAIGNLIDRLMQGFVFDWILLFGQSAINLADIAIIEGAIVYLLWKWLGNKRVDIRTDNSTIL